MKSIFPLSILAVAAVTAALKNTQSNNFDVLIKNGTVYDGTGSEGQHVDLAIRGDRIAQPRRSATAATRIIARRDKDEK